MAVTLSAALIAQILAVPNNPRTAEEWIIGAINYLHSGGGGGGGDIMSDGSVNFTGQETFGAGLKTDTLEEATGAAGVTIVGAGGLKTDIIGIASGAAATLSINNDDSSAYIRIYGSTTGGNTSKIDFAAAAVDFMSVSGDITFPSGSKFDSADSFRFLANNGIKTGTITEQVGAAGVTIAGTGGLITSLITRAGDIAINTTSNGNISIVADRASSMASGVNFDLNLATSGTGLITASSAAGTIELTPNTGWTASAGTASKAGIDSDNVIYSVGALQNLARAVVAIQNTLMLKGHFIT